MIIVMKPEATKEQIEHVCKKMEAKGRRIHKSEGVERTIIGLVGDERTIKEVPFKAFPGVENVLQVLTPYKLASKEFHPKPTIISVGSAQVGGKKIAIMAGPCSVESREQIMLAAKAVKKSGATFLRGGAFKPRTSPYSFQGMGEEGLKLLAEARKLTGLPVVTEVMDTQELELVAKYADVLQIGARNMQNFKLLTAVGKTKKPVLLKRGPSATLVELLMSAEYIMAEGNPLVILCERGIRTFNTYTRNTLDLNIVPKLKQLTHLPVLVDPSHGTGDASLVLPMARGGVAVGADALMVEVHPKPEEALSDGDQSLTFQQFEHLMKEVQSVALAIGRTL